MSVLNTEKLKNERLRIGITQTELALRTGISANYYSEIEAGKKTPTVDILIAIIDALNLESVDGLLKRRMEAKGLSKTRKEK